MKGTEKVIYNGDELAVKDIPVAAVRQSFGYGHYNPHNRQVVNFPGLEYPFTPDTCEVADLQQNLWVTGKDGNDYLVCTGCGLDGT